MTDESDTVDARQLEMFERDFGDEMQLSDLTEYFEKTYGDRGARGAMQIAALMLCCDVIAQDISKATLRLREMSWENGTAKNVDPRRNATAEMLALDPNGYHSWRELIEMVTYWSCLTDNAYIGIKRARDDSVLELIPFQSGQVLMNVTGREVFYQAHATTQYEYAVLGAASMDFPARDMIHIRTRFVNGQDGTSSLKLGRKTIENMLAIDKFRNQIFSEDGQLRGIFTTEKDGEVPEIAFQRLRQQMKILMSKFRQMTEPIVLEHGLKFQATSSNPKDIELATQFEAQINEVCRLFRMPPHKIFLLSSVKYENLESMEKMYVGDTLLPRAEAIEQELGRKLLNRKERLKYRFEFNRAEMTFRDTKAETDRQIRSLERAGTTFDEFRAHFGMNPLPNGMGKCRMIPTNMTVVNERGEVVIAGSSTADPNKPDDETPESQEGATGSENETDEAKAEKATALRIVK